MEGAQFGTWFDDWRKANFAHVLKKGQKDNIGNYSMDTPRHLLGDHEILLNSTSGPTKKKVANGNSQHGFTKRNSCLTNQIAFCDEMTEFVNTEKAMGVINLDFNKAFNTVSVENVPCVMTLWMGGKLHG